MNNYKCGVVSVSFRNHSPEEIIIAAKNAGLDCIEWGSDVHAPFDNMKKVNEIIQLQNKYGISCSSYGTYFRFGKDDVDELQRYIDTAKLLGTDILRLWCGDRSSELYSEDEKQELYAECIKAAKIAEENGAILCMECHNGTYTQTVEGALELMGAVDTPNFCMYWQPNQFKTIEDNIKYATLIAPYCKRVHVFNWDGSNKFMLSDGINTWKKYVENLKNVDTFLLEFMPDDNIESLKDEGNALLQIIERGN